MTLPLVWQAQAIEDLESIAEYIAERNEPAALRLAADIESSTWALASHPNLYKRSHRIPDCREIIVHKNYILIYRVELECVRVLRVVHSSRVYLQITQIMGRSMPALPDQMIGLVLFCFTAHAQCRYVSVASTARPGTGRA